MRTFNRFGACLLVLFLAVVTIGDARAASGVPAFVGATAGAMGVAVVYEVAPPFALDGWGILPALGAVPDDRMFQVAGLAAAATPPKFLIFLSPACPTVLGTGVACGPLTAVYMVN